MTATFPLSAPSLGPAASPVPPPVRPPSPPAPEPPEPREPGPFLWTKEQYHAAHEMGWFEGRRVELVEGEVIEMGKQSEWHVVVCAVVVRVLAATFGPAFWVRWPSPIDAGGISEPEPDAAVVPGRPQDYAKSLADGHPSQPLLVVEVAVTSLNYDRTVKGSLYAKAGIAEYWIVDVVGKRLEVHRKPGPAAAAKYGFAYAETQVLAPADAVSPLARPEAKVAVADLLA